jgi:hypothetical protein
VPGQQQQQQEVGPQRAAECVPLNCRHSRRNYAHSAALTENAIAGVLDGAAHMDSTACLAARLPGGGPCTVCAVRHSICDCIASAVHARSALCVCTATSGIRMCTACYCCCRKAHAAMLQALER